jgi:DNA replication and repair protein RecF
VRIDRFEATHFRNLSDGGVEFGPGLNLIVGSNGQGKTNLLEAVYFFRFGRSFRAQVETELIRFGESFCRAEVDCTFADGRREAFAFAIERREARAAKTIKINGEVVARRADLAGRFPVVLFGPHDLRVVSGEPEHRRRFFDMIGSMTDPGYLRTAAEYRRVVEQRNAALKGRAPRDEMAAWNEQLVATGTDLVVRRIRLVASIEREMAAQARDLESPFGFTMRYDVALYRAEASDTAALSRAFHEKLGAVAQEEARRGVTLVGPHRDDVELVMDAHDLRRFGSQGQRRLFAVLLKLAEMSYLETELHEPCALLLDDVFAEFDEAIMRKLQRLLDGERQVFVTSPVPIATVAGARVHRVESGRVSAP